MSSCHWVIWYLLLWYYVVLIAFLLFNDHPIVTMLFMSCKCCWFHVRMIFSILLSVKIHCMFSYLMLKETDEASETDLAVIFINNPQAVWVSAFIFTVVTLSDYIFILNSEVDYFPHFFFYHRFFGSRKTSSFQPKVFRSRCFFRLCKVI